MIASLAFVGLAVTSTHAMNGKLSQDNIIPNAFSGGKATVTAKGRNAFSLPSANMPLMEKLDFSVGNSFFTNPWVVAPATTDARDGLGPLMNTNGCQNCHIKDGRGHAPSSLDDSAVSLLVRLSIPESESLKRLINQSVIPEPSYGDQLQDFAIAGVAPEGKVQIHYKEHNVRLAGGEIVTLRKPTVTITELAYGDLHPKTLLSARIAPPMIGLGLLESIDIKHILANEDINDVNNDGISGRANSVWSGEHQKLMPGLFGWKAGQPTVREQNAGAFNGDLGITSHLLPNDHCTNQQPKCQQAPHGGKPELSDHILNVVTFYSKNLAVPARRNVNDPEVKAGEQLFASIGCTGCHQPVWKTAKNSEMPWLGEQLILPYSDLLLHDMGEGLADNRPEFLANGQEWRTPPLWGIGLTKVVSGEANFLHDGRARNITEAIMWHGGEAKKSQQEFSTLNKKDRQKIIAFINSL